MGTLPRATQGEPSGYWPALDGLRAVSVAAVIAFHLGHLRGGFLGVDVFFAISGFLITGLLLAEVERTGTVALRAFWVRRFRRLVPALLVVLVATVSTARVWLPAWRATGLRSDALAALAYVANWRFSLSGQSYFEQGLGPSPLRHTWSLAIEEQFYLVWPLLVLAAVVAVRGRGPGSVRRAVAVVAGTGTLLSAIWMAQAAGTASDLSRVYYGTDTRAFALCAGAWLATGLAPWLANGATDADRRRRSIRLSTLAAPALAVLAVLVVLLPEDDVASYRYGFQAAAVLAVIVVAALVTGEGPVAALLGAGPLQWLGRRSYGIYLWSWPIQVLVTERYRPEPAVLALVVVVGSLLAASLSFALVEEPVRRGGWVRARDQGRRARPNVPRPVTTYGFGLMSVGAVVLLVSVSAAGVPNPPRSSQVSNADALADALRPPDGASLTDAPTVTDPTVLPSTRLAGPIPRSVPVAVAPTSTGDPMTVHGRPLRVLVTGDSVAWSTVAPFAPELRPPSLVLDNRAIIGCGTLPADAKWDSASRSPEGYFEFCDQQVDADYLGLAAKPDVVMLWVGAWEVYDHIYRGRRYEVGTEAAAELVERQIQIRLDRYEAAGVVTVISMAPCYGPSAPAFGTERQDPERVAWVNERIRAVAEHNRGWVRVVDPSDVLCDADGKARPSLPTGEPIRADGAHFDEASAPWLWDTWLAGQLAAALDY